MTLAQAYISAPGVRAAGARARPRPREKRGLAWCLLLLKSYISFNSVGKSLGRSGGGGAGSRHQHRAQCAIPRVHLPPVVPVSTCSHGVINSLCPPVLSSQRSGLQGRALPDTRGPSSSSHPGPAQRGPLHLPLARPCSRGPHGALASPAPESWPRALP